MVALELDDIQRGVLRPRPTPYTARYIGFQVVDRDTGRELIRRLGSVVTSAADAPVPLADVWVSVALTLTGLRALGVPQASLDSLAWEFRRGMVANATSLGDVGESGPERWEPPLGTGAIHVVVVGVAPDQERLEAEFARVRSASADLEPGVRAIWWQDTHALPTETEHFGFRDGISHPVIEGGGVPGTDTEAPLKAGELVLGYPDELGAIQRTTPEVLGRNGSYVVFRKLHQRVAEFRRFLSMHSANPMERELLAAKLMGRWRSGAPLALAPEADDPALGADRSRNNAFTYSDDPIGLRTPPGSHIRRANPRDAEIAGVARLHRMLRRGTAYGPPLPEGVLDDDGVDRGLLFAFVGAHLGRQFEFVQSEWMNDGTFFGGEATRDPIAGSNDEGGEFTVPRRPVRQRLTGLSRFVVTRGGEYAFLPGLRALRWIADPRS